MLYIHIVTHLSIIYHHIGVCACVIDVLKLRVWRKVWHVTVHERFCPMFTSITDRPKQPPLQKHFLATFDWALIRYDPNLGQKTRDILFKEKGKQERKTYMFLCCAASSFACNSSDMNRTSDDDFEQSVFHLVICRIHCSVTILLAERYSFCDQDPVGCFLGAQTLRSFQPNFWHLSILEQLIGAICSKEQLQAALMPIKSAFSKGLNLFRFVL